MSEVEAALHLPKEVWASFLIFRDEFLSRERIYRMSGKDDDRDIADRAYSRLRKCMRQNGIALYPFLF